MSAVVAAISQRLSQTQPSQPKPQPAQGQHSSDIFGLDNSGLLFKQVTPRRRTDHYGRDSTRHADYLLSMAVFPTGVRTPLLSDLQRKTEHQCGFQGIDKGNERRSARHVNIQDRKPNSGRRDSVTDSLKKPPPNTLLTVSIKLTDRTHVSRSISLVSPSSRKTYSKDGYRWVNASTPGTRSCSTGGNEDKPRDIRDPLYLNTYCPAERTLRYKKTTLPRISTRARPWTVSESNPSYRVARNSQDAVSVKQNERQSKVAWHQAPRQGNFRIDARDVISRVKGPGGDSQAEEEVAETESMSGSQALLEVKSYFPQTEEDALGDQRDHIKGKDGCLHSKVKQCIKFVKYREKLARSMERPLKEEKGRYRPFSTTTVRTPRTTPTALPSAHQRHPDPISVEIYKEYIDAIALQTRLVSAADKRKRPRQTVSGLPRYNTAASSYRDGGSSVHHSLVDSAQPTHSAAASAAEKKGHPHHHHHNVKASEEPDILSLLQPVLNSLQGGGGGGGGKLDKDPGEGLCGGADPLGVHQALDIIRLSPKAQPPRSSRNTARGCKATNELEGIAGGGGVEGEGEREQTDQGPKTHAIFLPNACKSATTSVCSFPDEPVNAPEP
ncbi:uncharacterized protein [Littorina saxatilis]|uniref:Uncharacterized protein n=1 Tax=Littorina saxatilis TaxID=31220 RepID=A0AAN9BNA4_9CAEN